jgi:hypothetical protein
MIVLILSPRLRISEGRARQPSSVAESARGERSARSVYVFASFERLVDGGGSKRTKSGWYTKERE